MKICKSCGKQNKDEAKFCAQCGSSEFEEIIEENSSQPIFSLSTPYTKTTLHEYYKKSYNIFLALLFVSLLLIVACGADIVRNAIAGKDIEIGAIVGLALFVFVMVIMLNSYFTLKKSEKNTVLTDTTFITFNFYNERFTYQLYDKDEMIEQSKLRYENITKVRKNGEFWQLFLSNKTCLILDSTILSSEQKILAKNFISDKFNNVKL